MWCVWVGVVGRLSAWLEEQAACVAESIWIVHMVEGRRVTHTATGPLGMWSCGLHSAKGRTAVECVFFIQYFLYSITRGSSFSVTAFAWFNFIFNTETY